MIIHALQFGVCLKSELKPRLKAYSESDVWAAVGNVELCIELCGARQFKSTNRLAYVADALLGCAVVRGDVIGTGEEIDPDSLLDVKVKIMCGENWVSEGDAKNNPGDSVAASLAALANELCCERGMVLKKGTLVICGHTCQASFKGRPSPNLITSNKKEEWGEIESWEGKILRAEFQGLGIVETRLIA